MLVNVSNMSILVPSFTDISSAVSFRNLMRFIFSNGVFEKDRTKTRIA